MPEQQKEQLQQRPRDNITDRKENFLSSYKWDKDYQTISEITNSIIESQELNIQDIKDILPDVIKENKDNGIFILWIIREDIKKKLSENTSKTNKEDTDLTTQDTDVITQDTDANKEDINKKYSTIEQELSTLKNAYPSYQISEQYIQDNLNIFPIGTSFNEIQQRTLLTYKYILEQIVAEKTTNQQPLTSYERTLITNFNTFCFDTGIDASIDLPPSSSINSMRDVINDPNLYNTNYFFYRLTPRKLWKTL
jgi:hypothetical protein